jgi:hypothetical protein
MYRVWRCAACAEVITVLEPMIVVDRAGERCTSVMAEPGLKFMRGDCYHEECRMESKASAARLADP